MATLEDGGDMKKLNIPWSWYGLGGISPAYGTKVLRFKTQTHQQLFFSE
jgi:hypothetical protein